jgi:ankyrin repeat protein
MESIPSTEFVNTIDEITMLSQNFLAACKKGNINLVKKYIAEGFNPKYKNNRGLILCAIHGHLKMVKYFVGIGCMSGSRTELQMTSDNSNAALEMAAEYGHLDIVEYLEDLGADLSTNDNYALRNSSYNFHWHVVKYLLNKGCDPNVGEGLVLCRAVQDGNLEIIKLVISKGCDLKLCGYDAVARGAKYGHLNIVKYLVNLGCDFKNSRTLIYAAENGHLEIVKYLIRSGDDYYENKLLALNFSCSRGRLNVIEYLISNGNYFVLCKEAFIGCLKYGYYIAYKYLLTLNYEWIDFMAVMEFNIAKNLINSAEKKDQFNKHLLEITEKRSRYSYLVGHHKAWYVSPLRSNIKKHCILKQILRPKSLCIQMTIFCK